MAFNLNFKFKSDADQAYNSMKRLQKELTNTGNKFTNLTKDVNRTSIGINKFGSSVGKLASVLSAAYIGKRLADFTQSAMDSIETVNLFSIALGDCAEEADGFVKILSDVTGLDVTNLQNATATYALLSRSMGMTSEQAKILSENTTKLALDLSSAVNVPFTQAMQDLRSGLVGQTETVYKYGIDLTEASLRQEALRQGISKSVDTMSQAEKMALRYCVMLRQTSIVQGDLARTINQPANQLRILTERLTTCGRAIGSIFIPMLEVVLPFLNAFTAVITKAANALASLFGYKPEKVVNGVSGGFGGISDNANNATKAIGGTNKALKDTSKKLKEIKNATNGIDELNIISPPDNTSGSGGSGGAGGVGDIGGGLADLQLPEYDMGTSNIQDRMSEIQKKIEEFFANLPKPTALVGDYFAGLGEAMGESFTRNMEKFGEFVSWDRIGAKITNVCNNLGTLFNNFMKVTDWFTVGSSFGELANSIFNGIYVAVTSIDFNQIGVAIGNFLNGAMDKIDWAIVGKTLVLKANALVDILANAVTTFNWSKFGQNIATMINNAFSDFDWKQLATGVANFWNGVFDAIINFTETFDWSGMTQSIIDWITTWFETIDWSKAGISLGNLAKKLTSSLLDLIDGINWKQIGESFGHFLAGIDWFGLIKDVFFIIIDACAGLLITLYFTLNQWLMDSCEKINKKIEDWWNKDICKYFTWEYWKGLWENILQWFKDGWNKVTNWWSNTAISTWFKSDGEIGKWFQWSTWVSLWNNISQWFQNGWSDVCDWWNSSAISQWFNDDGAIGKWFQWSTWSKLWDKISQWFKNGWQSVVDWWNSSGLCTWFKQDGLIGKWFQWSSWEQLFTTLGETLKSGFKAAFNTVAGVLEKIINSIIDKLNKFSITIPEGLPFGGKTVGFNLSHVVIPKFLARGGMLSSGDIFEAGENGMAELIGSHKGKTTVMPLENTDFVNAMYKAVRSAMQENNNSNNGTTIVKIGDEVVYRSVEKSKQRNGYKISKNYAGGLV